MYDVVIIGSGVAGSLIADDLSQKGLSVLILEAGINEQDRAKLMDRFYSNSAKANYFMPYANHEQVPQPSLPDPHQYYVQKGPELFYGSYIRRVGGTTWMWLGMTPRFVPNDFKTNTLYGYGDDWPIDFDDILPWYEKAEKELNISLTFPQSCPDKWVNSKLEGKTFEGKPLHFESIAQARDPKRCCGNGICIPICPVQAKYDATIHVNKAVARGVTLIAQANVYQLHAEKTGRISGVSYYDWDKKSHTVSGKYVIVAAHAIESPKLLLQSVSEYFPHGIGNQHDQVGRYLMDHPLRLSIATTPENINPYRGPLHTSGFFGFRDGETRKDFMPYYTAIQNDAGSWPNNSPNADVDAFLDKGLYGKQLRNQLHETLNRQLTFCSMAEQAPNPENRVKLANEVDYYGLPRPELHYSYSALEKRSFAHMETLHDAIYKAIGASNIVHHSPIFSACHIMGTLRMGTDPKRSVVDSNCQVHHHENLFIAGSSVFTTSGTANPTLTLSALALRLADYIYTSELLIHIRTHKLNGPL